MKLILKKEKNNTALAKWLQIVSVLSDSIVLEIKNELGVSKFVTKAFDETKSNVRRAEISFEECGIEFIKCLDGADLETNDWNNILIGIHQNVKKFISIINTVTSSECEITIIFEDNPQIKIQGIEGKEDTYAATGIIFKTDTLDLTFEAFKMRMFTYLDDYVYNTLVFKSVQPATITITPQIITNIEQISAIYSVDSNKELLNFYNRGDMLYVRHKDRKYDYKIGKLEIDDEHINVFENKCIDIIFLRSMFIESFKEIKTNTIMTLSTILGQADRVLLETDKIKTVIVHISEDSI